MGNRENAAIGMKLFYKGEILSFISGVLAILGAIILAVAGIGAFVADSSGSLDGNVEAVAGVGALLGFVVILAAAVVGLIGFIKDLKGLHRAGKDNAKFQTAFYFVLFCLALSAICILFQNKNPELAAGFSSSSYLVGIGTAYYVVQGIMQLLPNTEFETKGRKLMIWMVVTGVIRAVCKGASGLQGDMVIVFAIAGLVATVIWYVLYLSYLKNAKDAL